MMEMGVWSRPLTRGSKIMCAFQSAQGARA